MDSFVTRSDRSVIIYTSSERRERNSCFEAVKCVELLVVNKNHYHLLVETFVVDLAPIGLIYYIVNSNDHLYSHFVAFERAKV
jgi:hypothetical protein